MYIGIDCGTQGTKVIVVDSQQRQVIGVGYAPHAIIENSEGAVTTASMVDGRLSQCISTSDKTRPNRAALD
ncbi:hypothetical protein AAUPMC_14360 [Pasteurella multocida subsp. multocida str. Anand1_cattle]|nr:hypothetical protein AAUPMC_14360 [Pasteurella multocida subsp. multocida str. Anand1_cattle]